jgi:hypothetical protein
MTGRSRASLSFKREDHLTHFNHVAQFGAQREYFARKRRRKLDGGFIGHDFAQRLVILHHIAYVHLPRDEFTFMYAFT